MTDKDDEMLGEEQHQQKPTKGERRKQDAPITTGDLQEVGATKPEEYARRKHIEGEPPVHEDPGSQVSG